MTITQKSYCEPSLIREPRMIFLFTGPPTILVKPQSQQVKAGGIASFYCTAEGAPPPQIHWRKNGKKISRKSAHFRTFSFPVSNPVCLFESLPPVRSRVYSLALDLRQNLCPLVSRKLDTAVKKNENFIEIKKLSGISTFRFHPSSPVPFRPRPFMHFTAFLSTFRFRLVGRNCS